MVNANRTLGGRIRRRCFSAMWQARPTVSIVLVSSMAAIVVFRGRR